MKNLTTSSLGSLLLGYTAGTAFVLTHIALHGLRKSHVDTSITSLLRPRLPR